MSDELLPCPFCGSQVTLLKDGWGRIECDTCLCEMPAIRENDNPADLIRDWNTRHLAQPEAMTPMEHLPDCMMPDGADPCKGYTELQAVVVALRKERDKLEKCAKVIAKHQPEAAEPFGDADILISAAHLLQRVMDCDWEESIEPQLGSAWVNAARDVILWVEEKPAAPVAAQRAEGAVAEVTGWQMSRDNPRLKLADGVKELPIGTKLYLRPASASGLAEELLSFDFRMTRQEIVRIRNTGCGNEWPKVWNRQLNGLCDAHEALRSLITKLRGQP